MSLSPLIRLAPFQPGELPAHPSLTDNADKQRNNPRPELTTFVSTLLDHGVAFVHPTSFNLAFKSHSWKSAAPSNNDVEVLSSTVSADALSNVSWSSAAGIPRSRPRSTGTEFWYARRSTHRNSSVKTNRASANWPEFVYGLRDDHSVHEKDFTPTIYDARCAVDWTDQLDDGDDVRSALQSKGYGSVTLKVFEMCHKVPAPMSPRVFPVLVATADVLSDGRAGHCFVAVTVPINLTSFAGAFYSTGRNRAEGSDALMRKEVVLGSYVAVEKCERYIKRVQEGSTPHPEDVEEIEWLMATASDARGNAPSVLQRMSMPGAIVKDVGLFLKWIRNVPDHLVRGHGAGTTTSET